MICRFDRRRVWNLHLSFAFQVALGLNHAHQCDYVHGDIKSANILVTDRMQVKIADFGLAVWRSERFETMSEGMGRQSDPGSERLVGHHHLRFAHSPGIESENTLKPKTMKRYGGSLLWAAPELFLGKPITKCSDIYAFGIVLWELATSELPYAHCQDLDEIAAVR